MTGEGKRVTSGPTIETIEYQAQATIEYQNYQKCIIDVNNRAKVEMLSASEIEARKRLVPLGGKIIVNVSASSISGANTEYWKYIIQTLDGKTLVSQSGVDNVPSYTVSRRYTNWWNIDIVNLEEPITVPFKVYIINTLLQTRSVFIVYPNQTVQ